MPASPTGKLAHQWQDSRRVPIGRGVSAGARTRQVPEARRKPGEPVGAGPVGLAVRRPRIPAKVCRVARGLRVSRGPFYAPTGGLLNYELAEARTPRVAFKSF